ncbi:ABC transporter ATP-binding protein [Nonomuraea cypriaca]|uniref:ABC transporter ATP-binding protein n=1 Tax=Nonomuraea cypriaca TaxID=1187855 RepID=UPI001A9C3805
MLTLRGLTKRYSDTTAVADLTLDIKPGRVTGFLGPNGAGKSTTMRVILGLDRPTAGEALVNGRRYEELRFPAFEVGALLEAGSVHPGRSARHHLRVLARTHGISHRRVEEVLEFVELTGAANKRAGSFSLGMGQRLGLAAALLGDPQVLILDEPVNGLDPDGVRQIRELMRSLAAEGRTVFVSSHLMSEMQLTADQIVVINQGKLVVDAPADTVIRSSSAAMVRVQVPRESDMQALLTRLSMESVTVERIRPGAGHLGEEGRGGR